MITRRDEYFHERSDDPHWNESGWFSFMVPERRLSGMVYCYHRPNMGYSTGGFAAWDPTGDRYDDCLWYDLEQISPLAARTEMFDFTLPSGLTVACVEPLHEYRLHYKDDGCDVDFTWRRARPPYSPPLPASQSQWGRNHYDQIGRMTGRVEVDGETIDVDGWSMRDHSWGPRKVAKDQRGRFVWAIASENDAFLVWASAAQPPDRDPVVGVPERVVAGWYLRDALAVGRDLPVPPPGAPGPFGMADTGYTTGVLTGAGFTDVAFTGSEQPFDVGPDADDAYAFAAGMQPVLLMLADLDEPTRARALDRLRATIAAHETADGVVFRSAAWVITARKP